MAERQLLKWGFILALLTLVAIFAVDRPLATALQPSVSTAGTTIRPAVDAIELAFGFPVSKFLTGAVLLCAALALFPFVRFRSAAWLLLLFGVTQLTTRLVAGVLKNVFLRPRPYQALAGEEARFFTDGSSFPSGHAAHFWPFFFIALVAFPRWRIPLLLLAVLVSLARVMVNDHYLGDVLASATIAALVAYGYARALLPRVVRSRSEVAAAGNAV